MKKIIFPLLVLLAMAFASSEGYAQRGRHGKQGYHGHEGKGHKKERHHKGRHHKGMFFGNPEKMKKKLGLSDEQVDKIGEINIEYKKKLLKIREQIAPKKIRLKSILLEDNVNLDKVKTTLTEISKLKVEIRMLRIKQRLDIEKVLTSSQRTKLKNSRMYRHGMGPHDEMGPPPPHDDDE